MVEAVGIELSTTINPKWLTACDFPCFEVDSFPLALSYRVLRNPSIPLLSAPVVETFWRRRSAPRECSYLCGGFDSSHT